MLRSFATENNVTSTNQSGAFKCHVWPNLFVLGDLVIHFSSRTSPSPCPLCLLPRHPSIHLRPGMDRREWMKRGTIRGQWYNHNNKKRDRQNPFITCNVQVSGVCAIAYNHLCSLRIILWLSAMRKCETVTGPSTVKRYLSCPALFPPRIIR